MRATRLHIDVLVALLTTGSFALASSVAAAQSPSVEEFYRGRQVQVLIGFPVSTDYDRYGRAVARHLGKHIPGRPTVIPVNRPGAGSLTVTNLLYNTAPKDGTTIAHFNRSVPLEPLMGNPGAHFDGRKFTWLGSVGKVEGGLCIGWHTAAVKTWSDLLTRDFVAGATSYSSDTGILPLMLKNLFKARIKTVVGYPGGTEIGLAMERGEIDGRCGWSWSSLKSQKPEWLTGKKINVLVQLALHKNNELPDVPFIMDQATNDEQRDLLKLILSRHEFAWPFAAPPDIPADRKEALRNAFAAMLKDPEFLAEARKTQLDVSPVSAAEIEKLIEDLYATPEATLAKLRTITSP